MKLPPLRSVGLRRVIREIINTDGVSSQSSFVRFVRFVSFKISPPHGISVDLWHLWEKYSRAAWPLNISHPTFHTFKRPLVHEVFAKVGSLLALDALLHLTWFGGVGNHADGVVVAHVFPQSVEQHHHLIFHA